MYDLSYKWKVVIFTIVVVIFLIIVAVCIYLIVKSRKSNNTQIGTMTGPAPVPNNNNNIGDWKPIKLKPECCEETCDDFSIETCTKDVFTGESVNIEEVEISNCSTESCSTCKHKVEEESNMGPCDDFITETEIEELSPIDYYTNKNLKLIDIPGVKPNQVKDITQKGSLVVVLDTSLVNIYFAQLYKGKVNKVNKAISKLAMSRIIFFRGELYGINNNTLYCQDPGSIGKKTIYWYKVEGVIDNLFWMTRSINDEYLWLQSYNNNGQGTLYNCKLCPIETSSVSTNVIRIYGSCPEQKSEINTRSNELYIYSCKNLYQNIGMAVYNQKDEIVFIRPDIYPSIVKGMRLIKEGIYYLLVN